MPSSAPTPARRVIVALGRAVGGVVLLGLTACSTTAPGSQAPPGGSPPPPAASEDVPLSDAALRAATSDTEEDSVYPEVGDPLVDALHYQLDVSWTPEADRLDAVETLRFRATDDADRIPLDFSDALTISSLSVDGADASWDLEGKDLSVDHPVVADQDYLLRLAYSGSPEAYPAPSTRPDFAGGIGWTTTDDHEVWTLQEPYGAFTWYAVNDQPADKALYDFTLSVPEPWTGVANGALTASEEEDGVRTTRWHLDAPASSYLVTIAFGDYRATDLPPVHGVPITVWSAADEPGTPGQTAYASRAMRWLEHLLGPYPFDTLGILVVPGESGMESQTMITLGDTPYATSRDVVVHELAHHWYGDAVTPADWRDMWMNEGMAMYLQAMWEAQDRGVPVAEVIDGWARTEAAERKAAGPPGDYDPAQFGSGNVYYGPALMWQELRERIGDRAFLDVLRAWPRTHEYGSATREEYVAWIERRTGAELSDFFDAWLLDPTTPSREN